MESNKLSLNPDKSKVMFFFFWKISSRTGFEMEGVHIENVHKIKLLGVTIDCKLSWNAHIRHTTSLHESLAIISRVKHIIDCNALYTLYCSLILPYLTYCVEVWGNNYKNVIIVKNLIIVKM